MMLDVWISAQAERPAAKREETSDANAPYWWIMVRREAASIRNRIKG